MKFLSEIGLEFKNALYGPKKDNNSIEIINILEKNGKIMIGGKKQTVKMFMGSSSYCQFLKLFEQNN